MYSGNYSSGDRKGEWFQLYSIGFGGIPGRPIGDGPDGHSLWPSFVNIPCEYLESYYPLRIERWETVTDTGGAGLHRGGNGVDVAYRVPAAGHHRDPRRPLADLPVGRQRRRARRAGTQVDRPGRRHPRDAAEQVPRRAGRPGRRAALRHLGRRRVGRSARTRPRAGGPGGAARPGQCRGGSALRGRGRRRQRGRHRGHRGAPRRAARRPARSATHLQHGTTAAGDARRAARPRRGCRRPASPSGPEPCRERSGTTRPSGADSAGAGGRRCYWST